MSISANFALHMFNHVYEWACYGPTLTSNMTKVVLLNDMCGHPKLAFLELGFEPNSTPDAS